MGQSLDARERAELCDLFEALGPEAPTLCEGWSTLDLAAHLVVRERDLLAGPGIVLGDRIPALGRLTQRHMESAEDDGFEALVAKIRSGPPIGPFRIPGVGGALNLNEYFVHHEDVRRANGRGPRTDRPDLQDALWSVVRRAARLSLRRVDGVGVVLVRAGTGERLVGRRAPAGRPEVEVEGDPGELSLVLTGRARAAAAEIRGDADAQARFRAAKLGI